MSLQQAPIAAPTSADWHRIFDSLPDEHDYVVDELEGQIPDALRGTLYRNGPGLNEIGGRPFAHLFDGHGIVSQFTLAGGRVHYRNRVVRTQKYLSERDAKRPQARGFGELRPGGVLGNFLRRPSGGNAANTSLVLCGERLLALWEGGRPWELDPDTLETRGEYSFDGRLKGMQAFSAHPKHDPQTGETFNFGVSYGPKTRLLCYRIDPGGSFEHLRQVELPYPVMQHDFALTARHLVFVVDPIVVDVPRLALGRASFAGSLKWDPARPTLVVLVPRDGGPTRTVEVPPFFHFHVNNAYEDGSDTVVDLVRYDDYRIGTESLRDFRHATFDEPAILWRLRVRASGQVESHELCPWQCEFPQHDGRRTAQRHRYSYAAGRTDEGEGAFDAIVKVDHDGERWSAHALGAGQVAGEPIFVARAPEAAEDDGWLLSVVYDAALHRSRLVVLDARELERAPVAVAHLRHHVPLGFHGIFTERVAASAG